MTVDHRLFVYALDPQLQRQRWRLDEQLANLARALSALESHRGKRDALAGETLQVARGLAEAQAQRMDPLRARHALHYLANLHQRQAIAERELREAEGHADEQRDALAAAQTEIDKLERDRAECLAEHLREAQRGAQREVDQDWTARNAWRLRDAAQGEALS